MKRSGNSLIHPYFSVPVICALILLTMGAVLAGDSVGRTNIFLGFKSLDADLGIQTINEWRPEFGADLMIGRRQWPIQISMSILESEYKFESDLYCCTTNSDKLVVLEVGIGVCKDWQFGRFSPAICGGPMGAFVRFDGDSFKYGDKDAAGLGGWLLGSFLWRLGPRFNLGAELRYSKAKTALDYGSEFEAGGIHAGLLVGWGWPAGQ